jgi:uncharacterized delta-60 repeat protein
MYIGGQFTSYNGTPANSIISLNFDGTVNTTFAYGTGIVNYSAQVFDIKLDHNGNIVCAGDFQFYNGSSAESIVRILPNGNKDTSFNVGTGFDSTIGLVQSIGIVNDNSIIAVGQFTSFQSNPVNYIVKIKANGAIDNTFNIGTGFDDIVTMVDIQTNDKIVIGGVFTSYNGVSKEHIVKLNADGTIDNTFGVSITGFNGNIYYMIHQLDGRLVCVGDFTTYNGVVYNGICRLNPNGIADNYFMTGTGFNSSVNALTQLTNGKIVAGGDFTIYNGKPYNRIIRLNTNGSSNTRVKNS